MHGSMCYQVENDRMNYNREEIINRAYHFYKRERDLIEVLSPRNSWIYYRKWVIYYVAVIESIVTDVCVLLRVHTFFSCPSLSFSDDMLCSFYIY